MLCARLAALYLAALGLGAAVGYVAALAWIAELERQRERKAKVQRQVDVILERWETA